MMDNEVKTVIDISAGGITVGAVFDFLPEATALASLIWVLIRIYETPTIQGLLGKTEE
jgi:hypothetical protein